jgi:hypothetical protein
LRTLDSSLRTPWRQWKRLASSMIYAPELLQGLFSLFNSLFNSKRS